MTPAKGRITGALSGASPITVVVAIVAGAWALLSIGTLQMSGWLVQTDELQNVRLAMDASRDFSPVPSVHGERFGGISQLYSLVISPLFRWLSVPDAFTAVHLLNALFFASAAIPVYLLCRLVVSSRPAAYVVAGLAAISPWAILGLPIWGESLAYPLFLWALYASLRTVAAPSLRGDVLALVLIALAFLVRTQFLVLAVALPLAVLVHEVGYAMATRDSGRRVAAIRAGVVAAIRGHVLLAAAVTLAVLAVLVVGLAPLLGPYAGTVGEGTLLPAGTTTVVLNHVGIIGVACGVLPVVLGVAWLVTSIGRPLGRPQHAFAALASIAIAGVFVQAATFVVRFAGSYPNDRYFFYALPLLLVASAGFLVDGPRKVLAVLGSLVLFGVALTKVTFDPALTNYSLTPGSTLNPVFSGRAQQIQSALALDFLSTPAFLRIVILAAAVVLCLLVLRAPRRRLLPALAVAAAFVTLGTTAQAFDRTLGERNTTDVGNWVDRLSLSNVGFMPSRLTPGFASVDSQVNLDLWWSLEFRNKSILRPYTFAGSSQYTAFPGEVLTADRRSGRLSAPHLPRHVVVDPTRGDIGLRGREVGARERWRVIDLGARPRARWTIEGLSAGGTALVAGKDATLRVFGDGSRPAPVSVDLTVANPPGAPPWKQPFRVRQGRETQSGLVRGTDRRTVRLQGCAGASPLKAVLRSGAYGIEFEQQRISLIVEKVTVRARASGRCSG